MMEHDVNQLLSFSSSKPETLHHKTKDKEYQCNDLFLGIRVPEVRKIAKKYGNNMSEEALVTLLENPIHEYRLCSLIIMTNQMKKASVEQQKQIVKFYLDHIEFVNGWDLVDTSASNVLGRYLLYTKEYKVLYELAKSNDLWKKRISIVSTWILIQNGILDVTIDLSKILLKEKHDLIHKAVGWMLREVGKKDIQLLNEFIIKNYQNIPRTTLRYAIEKHNNVIRKQILKGDFSWNKQ
ncbi:MAG: DNA alkylation repair protein [Firmicutes bacterium]|nr:DNA alkylation repair protein [Bacillota bacterium]